MGGSWRIGKVAGVDIFVHWTFLLLIAWIVLSHILAGHSAIVALEGIGFVLSIFGCVVLHELGHALMARRFGVSTRDITLLPTGGVARLSHIPEKPLDEFLIAIAGPLVNLAIGLTLLPLVWLLHGFSSLESTRLVGGTFLAKVLLVNVGLAVFNLIPAFPMDGGRVLRAALVPFFGYLQATEIAVKVGQFVAIFLGIVGLYGNPILVVISLFILIAAHQEANYVQVAALLQGVSVRDAMMTRFRTLAEDDLLDTAVYELLASDQQEFPVLNQGRYVGLLRRTDLIDALRRDPESIRVGDAMSRECNSVDESAMLEYVFREMHRLGCTTVPVLRHGSLVGIVSLENIGEWLMIQTALRTPRSGPQSSHPAA